MPKSNVGSALLLSENKLSIGRQLQSSNRSSHVLLYLVSLAGGTPSTVVESEDP
jgi:hypothetical protein